MQEQVLIVPFKDDLGNTLGYVVLDKFEIVKIVRFPIPLIKLCFN